jgi:hypothetical protein
MSQERRVRVVVNGYGELGKRGPDASTRSYRQGEDRRGGGPLGRSRNGWQASVRRDSGNWE